MIVSTDGDHKIKTTGKASAIYVDGTAGGGTAKLGTLGIAGFIPFKDGAGADVVVSVSNQYEIRHGQNKSVYLQLTGSISPNLSISASGIA